MKSWLLIGPGILAGLLLVAAAALWLLQGRLIYFPSRQVPPAPEALGLAGVAPIRLQTADGLSLLAWRVPPATSGAPMIIFLHGNGGSLLHRAGRVRQFQREGWGAILVEWRGFGGNAGTPREAGLLADATAALDLLREEGVSPRRIVAWGESLGTGVAIRLAAERPDGLGAVVLESPYTSLLALAGWHYPGLPARLLLRDRYDSRSRIGAVRVPILILQGGRDEVVPPAMGREVAAAATVPITFWQAPDAGHLDLTAAGAPGIAATFLRRVLPPG